MDDRLLALKILSKIEHDKAYSNIVLDSVLKSNNVSSASFVCALVYGVLERKITLDYYLSKFLTQPIKKLNPQVLTILRMGIYQIKYMDKVPTSAAVNESVKLTKKVKSGYASGLVNSILRKISVVDVELPHTDNSVYDLSIAYSCPENLVAHYLNNYGVEKTETILSSSVGTVPMFIRVNTIKTSPDSLITLLAKEGIEAIKVPGMDNALEIVSGDSLFATNCFKDGLFHVQDIASQTCIKTLSPEKGDVVFDMCSAPGGKSFTIAQYMENQGKVYSFDLYEHKIKLINDGTSRLGIDIIDAYIGDASVFNPNLPKADKILCDVPCSGLGVIRRKPEIKYKDIAFIDKLCDLQYNILNNASLYLKDKGVIVYSTCSLNKAENEEICQRFLDEHPNYKCDGMTTLFPHRDSDGFFFAKMIKE